MADQDTADRVAAEIAEWLQTRPGQVADAMLESALRPRVVEPSRAETVAYFRPLLLNPDGTINEEGKQQVIAQYGAYGYRDVAKALARAIRAEAEEAE